MAFRLVPRVVRRCRSGSMGRAVWRCAARSTAGRPAVKVTGGGVPVPTELAALGYTLVGARLRRGAARGRATYGR